MRRDIGGVGIADVLLLVIVADAAQNAMAGEYKTIADGLVLICTLLGWNLLLDWATYRFPLVKKLIEGDKLLLVENGRLVHRNLRKQLITEDELQAKLRGYGIENLSEVKKVYLENDGDFTVISRHPQPQQAPETSAREKV
jgi:uncharacterized membrane protein YcaP (DUF421 family)